MNGDDIPMRVLGLDRSTVEAEDLAVAASAAYGALRDRGVEVKGVTSGARHLDCIEGAEEAPEP